MFRAGQAQPGNLRQPGDLPFWGDDDAGDGLWVELEERDRNGLLAVCALAILQNASINVHFVVKQQRQPMPTLLLCEEDQQA